MKKNNNKLGRFTALVVLITLVALVLVSSTYAKYTTSSKGSDKARVAHWKINATNTIDDLFADTYTNVVNADNSDGTKISVIAPGTKGSYVFTIDGSVETSYTLKILAEGEDQINGAISGYNPIKYSFQKNSEETKTNLTFDNLLDEINKIDNGTTIHTAGNLASDKYTIGWEWAFDGEDAKDTELGNLVSTNNKIVSLSVNIVATQVD